MNLLLRWLFGAPRDERMARKAWAAELRREMDEHPAHRGEAVGRREARRIGDRVHFWRGSWGRRESGD